MKFFGEPPPRINTLLSSPLDFAAYTMAAVWFTSRFTSMSSFESRSAIAATFIPMLLSPGLLVKMGTPYL